MDAEPAIFARDEWSMSGACARCPLRVAMERIARAALRQHVLYLEGECQPRLELLRELEAASTLERLVRARICAVSRGSALAPDEIASAVDALHLWKLEEALNACAVSSDCPLDM